MKRLSLAVALVLGLLAPALAQNTVPQVGVTSGYLAKTTYSAAFFGLVSAGTTPTDVICISGSASKTIRLHNIKLSGSGTAISLPVTVLRRASLNTGGTPASTTANPANTISKRDTDYPTATAVPISYTANPTIVDTSPTYIDSQQFGVAATSVGVIANQVFFDWGKDIDALQQAPTLKGLTQQICLNFNSITSALLLTGSITWTEE